MSHTPTPWRISTRGIARVVSDDDNFSVADCSTAQSNVRGNDLPEVQKANAEFIVRACNAHDDLVEALRRLIFSCDDFPSFIDDRESPALSKLVKDRVEFARAALAQAGAKR